MSTVPIKSPPPLVAGGIPAARATDVHSCPAHVGGPVAPPCMPTVFIEGQTAARVGDLCTCLTGPPDAITKGSPTVFIGGQMAARLGDPTAHGGAITTGAARTFIGDGPGDGAAADCMKNGAKHGSGVIVN